ncbi:MAG: hypothetical protein ABIR03_08945 [Ginsengibacter sp.]
MNTNRNHEISLPQAIEMTTRYRARRPGNFPVCETFSIEAVRKLLATQGCASLRVYYGMKENMDTDALLVAVNAAGEDLLPAANATASLVDDPIILEDGYRCPEDCPPPSSLNE